jgi:type IV pilus assembly protein PilB
MDFAMLNKALSHEPHHELSVYLVRDGLLNAETLKIAAENAAKQSISLTLYLVRMNILSSAQILTCYAKHLALPIFDLANYDYAWLQDMIIKPELMYRYRILPLHHDQHSLHVGIADPTDYAALSAIAFHTGLRIHPMLVSELELEKILHSHHRSTQLCTQLESTLSKITPIEEKSSQNETIAQDDEPVSELVNKLLSDAIEKQVSDIHIEPFTNHCRIRFRRDGLLYEAATIPPHLAHRVITRLKILSNLNIAERRLPQDGRFQLTEPFITDIRINTCPTLFGEKIVLRILNARNFKLEIERLGLTDEQKKIFISKLKQPQGLILVTGPTGSGKTITLYSALHFLNSIEKNISSVEDPVEIDFAGINQVNINSRIGLDFPTVLRTLLRQDPDIIMIGEIRDTQTANIAIQAAQTGHLVLSTLHTNSAVETIRRLQAIGITAHNFIHSVSLIIAERLIRKLCNHCKQIENITASVTTYKPIGCEQCCNGYLGRIGIFEFIPMTDKTAQFILSETNNPLLFDELKNENGMLLWDAGLEKVKHGQTSHAELLRVLGKGS